MAIEIVDFPIKNGDVPLLWDSSPEGISLGIDPTFSDKPIIGGKLIPYYFIGNIPYNWETHTLYYLIKWLFRIGNINPRFSDKAIFW